MDPVQGANDSGTADAARPKGEVPAAQQAPDRQLLLAGDTTPPPPPVTAEAPQDAAAGSTVKLSKRSVALHTGYVGTGYKGAWRAALRNTVLGLPTNERRAAGASLSGASWDGSAEGSDIASP